MLPNTNAMNPKPPKLPTGSDVPQSVLLDFGLPKRSSGSRCPPTTPGAGVPEATIHEEGGPEVWEVKVGLSKDPLGVLNPPVQPCSLERYLDASFCGLIASAADLGHQGRALRRSQRVDSFHALNQTTCWIPSRVPASSIIKRVLGSSKRPVELSRTAPNAVDPGCARARS